MGHVRVILPDAIHTPRQDHLTREQAKRLVKNCVEPHAALFLLLALGTAARHRAILDLKWSAVTWPNGGGPSGDDGVPA